MQPEPPQPQWLRARQANGRRTRPTTKQEGSEADRRGPPAHLLAARRQPTNTSRLGRVVGIFVTQAKLPRLKYGPATPATTAPARQIQMNKMANEHWPLDEESHQWAPNSEGEKTRESAAKIRSGGGGLLVEHAVVLLASTPAQKPGEKSNPPRSHWQESKGVRKALG